MSDPQYQKRELVGGSGLREALRDYLGDRKDIHGVYGPASLRVQTDLFQAIHFYWIARYINSGRLASDWWPDALAYRPKSADGEYSDYEYDLTENALDFRGSFGTRVDSLYGRVRAGFRFVERVGTKQFGIDGYGQTYVELTPTLFQFRTRHTSSPFIGVEEQVTPIPYLADYLTDRHYYTIDWFPSLAIFTVEGTDHVPIFTAWHVEGVQNQPAPLCQFNSPDDSSMRIVWIDHMICTDLHKWQPPPLPLWTAEAVGVGGEQTTKIPFHPYESKTFYLLSDQAGTIGIDIDLGDGVWRTLPITDTAVTAATLWTHQTTYPARFGRITFTPTLAATVNAWGVLRI